MNKNLIALMMAGAALAFAATPSLAQEELEELTYLFPAPDFLPAFAPFQLAQHKGYYEEAGLDVEFRIGQGGADVASQVAVGNADLGGGMGDTSMIVRANGLEIRGVALLGGRGLTQLAYRTDSDIEGPADFAGKDIGVISFQDTAYYNLLAVLANEGISRSDANIQALGAGGIIQLMVSGDVQAMSGVPEWIVAIQDAGVEIETIPADTIFPALAQAIIASDDLIEERPEAVRGFVEATLRAIDEIVADPAQAAIDYVEAVPRHEGTEDQIERILRYYVENVYPEAEGLERGAFDPERLQTVQDFYIEAEIVNEAVPIDDVYTNQFVTE